MTKTGTEKKTVNYYNKNAKVWAFTHHGYEEASYWQNEMERFHELLPVGKILEVGSGSGKDAEMLKKMGYEYVGTDASEGLIKVARKRNPKVTFRNVGVYDLDFPKHEFDGFWTVATLLHIPKNRIDKALKKIKTQIKPGGIGFITMKAGVGEKEDPDTGRWFAYYSRDEFQKVLERNGYRVVEEKSSKGEKNLWLCFWVKV